MDDSYKIGNKLAISMLNSQIKELTAEVNEIESILIDAKNVTNRLAEDYNKKRRHLAVLEAKKAEILSSPESYSFGFVDNWFNSVTDDFLEKRAAYTAIPDNSKNKFAKLNKQSLKIKIDSLKKKAGTLSKFQRHIVSLKLKRQLRSEMRKVKNVIIDDNIAFYNQKYNAELKAYDDKAVQAEKDGQKIMSKLYVFPSIVSVMKLGGLYGYCNLLKFKNNLVEGAIQLPKNIVEAIKNKSGQRSGPTR